MTSTNDSTATLTSRCLCRLNVFTAKVLKSKLPLPAPICHCWSCRHVTGALYTADVRWPEPSSNVDVSKLKAFAFTPRVNLLFCPVCSTPMFWQLTAEPGSPLGALTGTLVNDKICPIRFTEQSFVGDTIDGGASVWLKHANADGFECSRFEREADDCGPEDALPRNWPTIDNPKDSEEMAGDSVAICCKCRGVDLILQRGDYSGIAKEQLSWHVDPDTHKLSAVFCGCDSCRLQGGLDVWYWAFFNMQHLCTAQGGIAFPKSKHELKEFIDREDPVIGTLAYYASATRAGVLRFFCSNCSATVFVGEDKEPELLDVSVGLLDAADGARAESFLSWSFGQMDFKDDANGGWRAGHFENVELEAEKWRIARGYPRNRRGLGGIDPQS